MGKFAEDTQVPVEKTKAEIERTVVRYGATGFVSGWVEGRATIQFRMNDRLIRFVVDLPRKDEQRFTHTRANQYGTKVLRPPDARQRAWEQGCRSIWRALLLVIKAKLEAVEARILTFEESFLAEIVMPDTGKTVWETVREPVRLTYEGSSVPLLPGVENAGTS